MSILPFTLRQLEVFARLAVTGSFRSTAEQLGISQASVSNQIKTLEDQLGCRLLDRKPGRRPVLTSDGQAFHDDLRQFEQAAQQLAAHRRRAASRDEPARFRLLVGQGMFDNYVRAKIDSFIAANPAIELEFTTEPPSHSLVRAIDSGQFDFALINQRSDQSVGPSLQRMARVRGGIFGHRDFVAGRKLPLTPEAISALPFFLPRAGSRQERETLHRLAQSGIKPRKVVGHTQYYDVMGAMLDRGVAIASYSEAIMPLAMRANVVRLLPMDDWYLDFFRKPGVAGPAADAVEAFLKASVLEDETYPAVEVFAP